MIAHDIGLAVDAAVGVAIRTAFVARVSGSVDAVDIDTGLIRWTAATPNREPSDALAFLDGPGGGSVLQLIASGQCRVLRGTDGQVVRDWTVPGCIDPRGHRHAMTPTPDGPRVLVECREETPAGLQALADGAASNGLAVAIHNPRPAQTIMLDEWGQPLARSQVLHAPYAIGPRSRVVYMRASEKWIGIEDLLTGAASEHCPHCFERGPYDVAVSPDGSLVAWSGYDKYMPVDTREFVRLVDVTTDDPENAGHDVLRGAYDYLRVRFSPSGRTLAASTLDGGIEVVNVAAGKDSARIVGRVAGDVVLFAYLTEDDLVSIGSDGELALWSLAAPTET